MYKEDKSTRPCDCICRFSSEGEITPLKIQFVDDDGNRSEYMIKAYKVKGRVTDTINFVCKIEVYETLTLINLSYNTRTSKWSLRPVLS